MASYDHLMLLTKFCEKHGQNWFFKMGRHGSSKWAGEEGLEMDICPQNFVSSIRRS